MVFWISTCFALRLWDSVLPTHGNYRAHPYKCNIFCARDQYRLFLTALETVRSSLLNRVSNLRASWPKKISLWVSYDHSTTTRAVAHIALFSVKLVLPNGTSSVSYRSLNCSTIAKLSLAFQRLHRMKNAPHGPVLSWKLHVSYMYIISFDSYLAVSLTKTDVRFCQVDLCMEVNGWRVSSCFSIV